MSKHINIGVARIPLHDFAVARTGILGITRSGKTVAAKGIAEQLLDADIPIIVFDAIGVWRYLKTAAPGKGGRGYPIVIAGGETPDLPLTKESAPEIVRAAIRENIPLVIDLYDPRLSKADWRKIVQLCFRTLLYENRGVRHVFLEEAAEYAPQRISGGDGETYAEVEKLARMGGNRGVGITFVNQRAQELNKAVLELCDNLLLFRQRGSHAIDSLEKWLNRTSPDVSRAIAKSLPHMTQGDCWVWTEDSEEPVRTRTELPRSLHPDRRAAGGAAPATGKSVDTQKFVERLSGKLGELVERAKADDPKELRKRIAQLERELKAAKEAAPAAEVERVEVPVLNEDQRMCVRALTSEVAALQVSVTSALDRLVAAGGTLQQEVERATTNRGVAASKAPAPVLTTAHRPYKTENSAAPAGIASGNQSKDPTFRVLRALAWWRASGLNQPTREQVAFVARYTVNGHFNNTVGNMRTAGTVDYPGPNLLELTPTGLEAAPRVDPLNGGQFVEAVRSVLEHQGEPYVRVFNALIELAPETTREELAASSNYTVNGHFNNIVGRLNTLGVARYPRPNAVALGAMFDAFN